MERLPILLWLATWIARRTSDRLHVDTEEKIAEDCDLIDVLTDSREWMKHNQSVPLPGRIRLLLGGEGDQVHCGVEGSTFFSVPLPVWGGGSRRRLLSTACRFEAMALLLNGEHALSASFAINSPPNRFSMGFFSLGYIFFSLKKQCFKSFP